ncbi:MAG: elongation factor P [Deltaproteobacteria bacterium]|nr:elongation factor P [Deltaproteobacteria bacterium]
MVSATQIRVGNVIELNNELYRVLKIQHVTPGKGNAVVQTELRNLDKGNKLNQRFRSTENVNKVEIFERKMQFLYEDAGIYHFMDPETYDQVEMTKDILEEAIPFLIPETMLSVSLYEGKSIGVALPPRVTLKVAQCDPASKGQAGATKEAVMENGNIVRVPLFIKEGDDIVVDTATNSYAEKA